MVHQPCRKEHPNLAKMRKIWERPQRRPAEEQKILLKKFFMGYDSNHDNHLSREDLKKAFNKLGTYFPGYRAGRALSHADANDDGQIGLDHELDALVNYVYKLGYTVS